MACSIYYILQAKFVWLGWKPSPNPLPPPTPEKKCIFMKTSTPTENLRAMKADDPTPPALPDIEQDKFPKPDTTC